MIVVADTSVIINLALVGQSELLRALFRDVLAPRAVQTEFRRLVQSSARFAGLELPVWVQVRTPASIPAAVVQHADLHVGETERSHSRWRCMRMRCSSMKRSVGQLRSNWV